MADIGLDGNAPPKSIDEIPFSAYITVQSLINVKYGHQLMAPKFGFNFIPLFSRAVSKASLNDVIIDGLINVPSLNINEIFITEAGGEVDLLSIIQEVILDNFSIS